MVLSYRVAVACGALLLTFGVSIFLLWIFIAGFALQTCYTVIVDNSSQKPLSNVRIFGGGCDEFLGSIPSGDIVRKSLWFDRDGTLEFNATIDNTVHKKTIEGYVTNCMGGSKTVTVNHDGEIFISANSKSF